MPADPPATASPRSLAVFRAAPPEVQSLIREIMSKERQEQHKRNRTKIHQTLLEFIRESTP